MAVDGDDNILVVGYCRLLKFSRGGDLIAAVGDGPEQFSIRADEYGCVHIFNPPPHLLQRVWQ